MTCDMSKKLKYKIMVCRIKRTKSKRHRNEDDLILRMEENVINQSLFIVINSSVTAMLMISIVCLLINL